MVFITNNIREKWKWGIAQLCPLYDSFPSFLIQMMYTEHLFGGKIMDYWCSILIDILTYSDKSKFSLTNRHLGFLFLFLTKFIAGTFKTHFCTSIFLYFWQLSSFLTCASLLKFLSLSLFSLIVSELRSLCLFAGAQSLFAPALV